MTTSFDRAFAKAFSQRPRAAANPSAPARRPAVSDQTSEKQILAPAVEEHHLVIQIPAPQSSVVPSPHIEVANCQTNPPKPTAQHPSADPRLLESHTTLITPLPASSQWLVATIGVESPAPPAPADPATGNREDERTEVPAATELPQEPQSAVEQPPADPEVSEEPIEKEPQPAPALSAVDIPLLLEQEMLESLHRAADAMRSADDGLQATTHSVQAFLPVWEVDRFHWPEHVLELEKRLAKELSGAAEGIRTAAADGMQVLGLTALGSGAGRTTTMLLLARAVAGAGLRVVLVDATDELQSVAEQCGIDSPYGWNEAVTENKPLEEAATFSVADGIILLSWSPSVTDPLVALPVGPVAAQWQRLRQAVDLVLVELPTLETGVVPTLARHPKLCDAVVMVRSADDEEDSITRAVARLQGVTSRSVGIVDNEFGRGRMKNEK